MVKPEPPKPEPTIAEPKAPKDPISLAPTKRKVKKAEDTRLDEEKVKIREQEQAKIREQEKAELQKKLDVV